MILKVVGCRSSNGIRKCCLCNMAFDHKKCMEYMKLNKCEYIEKNKQTTLISKP